MKKWLKLVFVTVLVGGVVFFLFQKQIISTTIYVMTINSDLDQELLYTVPQPYQLLPSSEVVPQSVVTVGVVNVPLIFIDESNDIADLSYAARGEGKSVWIFESPVKLMDDILGDLEGAERAATCDAFSQATDTSACDSEHNFLLALFNTSPETTHWYSSTRQKVGFGILATLKSAYGAAEKNS
jgi:hypothetical protein